MRHILTASLLCASLNACASISGVAERIGIGGGQDRGVQAGAPVDPFTSSDTPMMQGDLDPATAAPPPPPAARTAEALDTTTAAQRAAAAAPAATDRAEARSLGRTVVTLGSATEPGLWMKTPLVETEAQGRVTNPATGQSSLVTLIPLEGLRTAGSRVSLSALRLIGASLTDLTEVEVALEAARS